MKNIFKQIFLLYFYIGSLIATVQVFSWLFYGIPLTIYHESSIVFSLVGIPVFLLSFFIHIILNPFIVMFTWLPSILSITLDPSSSITLTQYFLPGGFDMLISSE